MSNFSINTGFQAGAFNNSIQEFNKIFNDSINSSNKALAQNGSFEEVFSAVSAQKALEGGVQFEQIGLEANIKNVSPVENASFDIGKSLKNSLQDLNATQKDAERKAEIFASGGDISIHDVMISAQKSSLAMQMAIQLRNQVINAYNELKNTTV